MKVVDVIAHILKREGIEYLSAFPTTPLIDAVAGVGIRPIICRQERVGVGIADGYSRVQNGNPPGVFAMQWGPGRRMPMPGWQLPTPTVFRYSCCRWDNRGKRTAYFPISVLCAQLWVCDQVH